MKIRRSSGRALAAALFAAASLPARPQVPPHAPGTLCVTPVSWCQLGARYAPGSRCACPGPYGPVYGTVN